MKLGEASVELTDGVIRNAFPEIKLGKVLQVVVPTLVVVRNSEVEPIYDLTTERQNTVARNIRIVARCLGEDCKQLHLADTPSRLGTDYFRPRAGLELSSSRLPSVHAHTFGLIGSALGNVPALLEEVRAEPSVGKVMRAPQLESVTQ